MLVKHLIERLSSLDPNMIVIKSKDAEGNGFQEIDDLEEGFIREDGYDLEFCTEDTNDNLERVVCLW